MRRLRKGIECVEFLLSGFKIHARTAYFDAFFLYCCYMIMIRNKTKSIKNSLQDSINVAITDENSKIFNENIQVTEGNLPLILC